MLRFITFIIFSSSNLSFAGGGASSQSIVKAVVKHLNAKNLEITVDSEVKASLQKITSKDSAILDFGNFKKTVTAVESVDNKTYVTTAEGERFQVSTEK